MEILGAAGILDRVTSARVIVTYEHHKVHQGDHYTANSYSPDVDTGAVFDRLIKAGSKYAHLTFTLITSLSGLIEFFEAPTVTANGTLISTYNNNRNSTTTATMACYEGPTITATGTRLLANVIGTDGTNPTGAQGGATMRDHEFVLKLNTDYLIRFTPLYNNTRVSCSIDWYEG